MEHSASYLGELNSMLNIANEQKLEIGQVSLSACHFLLNSLFKNGFAFYLFVCKGGSKKQINQQGNISLAVPRARRRHRLWQTAAEFLRQPGLEIQRGWSILLENSMCPFEIKLTASSIINPWRVLKFLVNLCVSISPLSLHNV